VDKKHLLMTAPITAEEFEFFAKGFADSYRKTGLKVSVLKLGFVYFKMT
jgi:hypothetical protein